MAGRTSGCCIRCGCLYSRTSGGGLVVHPNTINECVADLISTDEADGRVADGRVVDRGLERGTLGSHAMLRWVRRGICDRAKLWLRPGFIPLGEQPS